MYAQIAIEMERDALRAKYDGKWQVMLPNSSKLFNTEEEVRAFVSGQDVAPIRNINYCRIECD